VLVQLRLRVALDHQELSLKHIVQEETSRNCKMSQVEEKSIKVICFDGQQVHWSYWEEKFLA